MNKRVLLFGGTADARELAAELLACGWEVTAAAATEYGGELLEEIPGIRIHTGRMDEAGMAAYIKENVFAAVVDATHPYACEATKNIRAAAEETGLPYLRLLRPQVPACGCEIRFAEDTVDAARILGDLPGNVLLTTGSKELEAFTAVPNYRERLYIRILPQEESLAHALRLGFLPTHILCMQGPFSERMNLAVLLEYGIRTLVTKDTGAPGGFAEKAQAAKEAGALLLVIRRQEETGLTREELIHALEKNYSREHGSCPETCRD